MHQENLARVDHASDRDPQVGEDSAERLIDLDEQQIAAIAGAVPGGAGNVQDIYPLSPLQEGMLFHHLMNEKHDTYILSTAFGLKSQAHVAVLIAALEQVLDRHDILRSAVFWAQLPRPVQVVCRHVRLPVEELLLEQDRDALAQIEAQMKPGVQKLDLRQAPMMRLQIAANPHSSEWYAIIHVHHLACDHQSLRILVSEVIAYLEGREQQLPPPVAFRSYVAHALLDEAKSDAQSFFRSKLADVDEPTAPFGILDVHADGSRIAEARDNLDQPFANQLRIQARRAGVTPARLFHAAWGLVVACTSARQDVVFGTVLLASSQRKARARRMLGLSVNTLPLRLKLHDVTAKEFVEQTQRELTELLGHDSVPLTVAQRCSGIAGSSPLFTSILNYRHSAPEPHNELASTTGVSVLARGEAWTNYPFTLTVDDVGDEFVLMAKTDQRIDPTRILAYLRTALESLLWALQEAPQTPALALSVLPESERRQTIESFNATHAAYPQHKLIHELIEEQVARAPQAVAVTHEGRSLTYEQLNGRANQLARYLQERGVGPDQRVALCVERSIDMLVGLLGVLKAGGAYVPLDPSIPADRLNHVLSDSRPRVLLTQQALLKGLEGAATDVILLDADWDAIARRRAGNLDPRSLQLTPRHLAYVIYTSGSTGRPKGVMIEHRSIVNYASYAQQRFDVASGNGSLLCSSISFDLVLTGLYPTLLAGRPVHLCGESQGVAALTEEILRHDNLSLLKVTPSHLALLEQPLREGLLAGRVRVLVLGGESLQAETVQLWRRHAPTTRIFNHYGPTEATVGCVVHEIGALEPGAVPIGQPISNAQVYILNGQRQPVPVGVTGELYIGGVGVARGYLNRPDLTAERFAPDPFVEASCARLYNTGDLARWRDDGLIEYLGRNDQQVKVRGYRIELGEIEAQLRRHGQVREAAVLLREDVPGEKRLVAYVTVRGESAPVPESLRAHVSLTLPDYMTPSAFVILESLPLTANGKLNRRALLPPEPSAYLSRQYEEPIGEVERMLADIWQSLLRIERVGRHDNFFELGGHSLLIMQMMERARRFGLAAEVRRIFESPVLAQMAKVMTGAGAGELPIPPNRIAPGCERITPQMLPLIELTQAQIDWLVNGVPGGAANVQDIYPLVPLQEGILFHHQLLDENDADMYVVPVVLSVATRVRLEELLTALQATIDRHDVLRTAVLWEHLPRPVQVVYRSAPLSVEAVEWSTLDDPNQQIGEWLEPHRQRMDPRHAPLIRARIAEDRDGKWHCLLQMHHVIADHVTLEALIEETVAHLGGCAHLLPESAPYRDHVARVAAYSATGAAAEFFKTRLADIEEPTAPFGLLNVHGDGSRLQEAYRAIEASLSQRLRAQARTLGVSAGALFHAAWALVVARTTGRDDVIFGTVLLGRWQGSAGTLGVFINTLPIRARLRNLHARQLVELMQRELVQLLGHEHASLVVAQQSSGLNASVPLFTALLNFRHSVSSLETQWSSASGIEARAAQGRTNYPITMSIDDLTDGFKLTAQTDPRIDAERLIEYFGTALTSLVEALESHPQRLALRLDVLPQSEWQQAIRSFNATQAVYPQHRLVSELFEEQVRRTPHALAVSSQDGCLTYAELNSAANQLAHYLKKRGVGPDQPVVICIERHPQMIAGLLGILKAGGAYVPLDPSYPAERLHHMLEDAAPRIVLTHAKLKPLLPDLQAEVIALDERWPEIALQSDANIPVAEIGLTPRNLVYVIYTSGSTGRPKGTAMSHQATVNLIEWHRGVFRGRERHRVLQFAALSFDVAFQEVFSTLSLGGTLRLIDEWVRRDAKALLRYLAEHSIQRLFLPPLMLQSLAESRHIAKLEAPGSLQDVVTAGEQLRIGEEVRGFFRHLPGCRLHNHYGPTESHVVTALTLTGDPGEWPDVPTIGEPIANARIYVLDAQRQPVPIGVPGEVYIGGTAVAQGYLDRPELTAERFVADPFELNSRARMYRTGDLGRWRTDGTVEYLGRNDDQVKIRGYRIELREVEVQLARHEQVSAVAVVVRQDGEGEKRLVAYVTPSNQGAPDSGVLRAHLQAVLPEHMIPSVFVVLDALPRTPSGKLDRRALPAPQLGEHVPDTYQPPRGEIEQAVAQVWRKLLRVERIGREDNFFELGGNSLLASRVMTHVSHELDIDLPLRALFDRPTIARLSGYIVEEVFSEVLMEAP